MGLRKYKCHKVVEAAKIKEVETTREGGLPILHLFFENREFVTINDEATQGRFPEGCEGGYYVVYADGYCSWSPAKAFEEGYSLVESDKHSE